jgi:hypothetical protein
MAVLPTFPSQRQSLERISRAMTMTGPVSFPQILTGADGVPATIIDSLPEPEQWRENDGGARYYDGAHVKHLGRYWQADIGIISGAEPGTSDWTELPWKLGNELGKKAAKITIQNCGIVPIYVSEGRSTPIIDAYHFCLPACEVADDGKGGFTQWDDFSRGCIRIAGIGGAWRAAVKIVWADAIVA